MPCSAMRASTAATFVDGNGGLDGDAALAGAGDVDWADVRKALGEIGFTGWCTAEVGGGDTERMKEIADRMNRTLGL